MATNTGSTSRTSSPPAGRGGATAAFQPGGLKDTLEKLRQVLENLAGGALGGAAPGSLGGLGGLGSAGLGAASGVGAAFGQMGIASVQAMAQQVRRTTMATADAFTASMGRVQRTWTGAVGQFNRGFSSATAGFQSRFTQSTGQLARGFERAFDASIGRVIHGVGRASTASARVARRAWTNPAGFAAGAGRGAIDFARDFASAWKNAAKGGIPVGGLGAVWGQNVRMGWQNVTSWTGRQGRRFGRGIGGFRRGATRGLGRRFRHARIRAARAFNRTGNVGAMAGAGIRGFAGAKAMAGLGEVGVALTALTGTLKAMQSNFEGINAGNRALSGYSGSIAAAFGQLALGDLHRNVKLARATEGSAVTLANVTNQSREVQGSFDRLNAGVNNRVASAQGVIWNGMVKPWAMASDTLNGMMNSFDPKGDTLARLAASPWSISAGVGGFLGTLWGGGSTKEAWEASQRAFDQQEKDALAGVAPTLDPAAAFIARVQNMGPIRPARRVRP